MGPGTDVKRGEGPQMEGMSLMWTRSLMSEERVEEKGTKTDKSDLLEVTGSEFENRGIGCVEGNGSVSGQDNNWKR